MTFAEIPFRCVFRLISDCDETLYLKSAGGSSSTTLTGNECGVTWLRERWSTQDRFEVVDAHIVVTSVMPEGK